MKNVLGILAVVALFAAPALAAAPSATCDVNLTVESFASVSTPAAPITINLSNGGTNGTGSTTFLVSNNYATVATASIVPVVSAKGLWTCYTTAPGTITKNVAIGTGTEVIVTAAVSNITMVDGTLLTATKQADLTLTITLPS